MSDLSKISFGGTEYNVKDTTARTEAAKKVTAAGGDISNTKITTADSITTAYPIPAAGDTAKGFLGKMKKFCEDIRNTTTGACFIGQIVNNCVTNNAKLPLSAAQGKVLMDLVTQLNRDLGGFKIYTSPSQINESYDNTTPIATLFTAMPNKSTLCVYEAQINLSDGFDIPLKDSGRGKIVQMVRVAAGRGTIRVESTWSNMKSTDVVIAHADWNGSKFVGWNYIITNADLINIATTNYTQTDQTNFDYAANGNFYSVKNNICTVSVMITAKKDVIDSVTDIGSGLPRHTGKVSYNFALMANDLKDVIADVNPIDIWITTTGTLRTRGGKNGVKYSGTLTYPIA